MGAPSAVSIAVAELRNARSVLGIGLGLARVQGALPARRVWVALVQGAGTPLTAHGVQPWVEIHSSPGGSAMSYVQ